MKLGRSQVIMILILFAGLFYWFSVRPENIRKECFSKVQEESVNRYSIKDILDTEERGALQEKYIDEFYTDCLRQSGLEK